MIGRAMPAADFTGPRRDLISRAAAFLQLMKPGISIYIGLTAWTGSLLGEGRMDIPGSALVLLAAFLMSAGSAAFNQAYEGDIDRLMHRTAQRPVVVGLVNPGQAYLWSGFLLLAGSALSFLVSPITLVLLSCGAFSYVVLYTVLTKRRTAWNVPIGGLCGMFAALAGAAAAGLSPAGLGLGLLLYIWSAPHFWALAILKKNDYAHAGIPMLPVVSGTSVTSAWIFVHSCALVLPGAFFAGSHPFSALFLTLAALGAVVLSADLYRHRNEEAGAHKRARRVFLYSLLHLMLVFMVIWLEQAMRRVI